MKRRELFTGGAAALALVLVGGVAHSAGKKKFEALYNGKDLSGWHVQNGKIDVWKSEGPLLVCEGAGGGWLTSDKEYGDFELHVDFKIPKGGNSGVGLRYPGEGDPAHVGMEIQILDDPAPEYKNLQAAQYTGGIYYQVPPKAHPSKPAGEWNHYEIKCEGPRVVIHLNGVLVQDCDVSKETNGLGGHKPLSQRPLRGFVGLQSHTDRVEFRNVEIREL